MSKEDKKPRNALVQLPKEEPKPAVVEKDPMEVSLAKLVQAGGPSAITSVVRGSNRVVKCVAGPWGLTVTQDFEGKHDTWFTPWNNVVWIRHG
jgi:hypothetical protein